MLEIQNKYPDVSNDFTGRQVDIEFMETVQRPANNIKLDLSMVNNGPRVVSGIQKVVQRYTQLLLTDLGSLRFDKSRGGEILLEMRYGRVYSEAQLSLLFGLASYHAITMMHIDDESGEFGVTPDDEKIKSATLLRIIIRQQMLTAELHIAIETVAGDSYVFMAPVKAVR